jgi:hypothetical protein
VKIAIFAPEAGVLFLKSQFPERRVAQSAETGWAVLHYVSDRILRASRTNQSSGIVPSGLMPGKDRAMIFLHDQSVKIG